MAIPGRAMITLFLACGLMHNAAGTVYQVGGDRGWTFESENSTFYDDQFKNVTLVAGVDWLITPTKTCEIFRSSGYGEAIQNWLHNFTFTEGVHNVIAVSDTYLAKCDASDPIAINMTHSWTAVTVGLPGPFGAICGVEDHCKKFGMHLNVTFVSPASSPSGLGITTSEVHADGSQPGGNSGSVVRSESGILYWQ